jgi:broad specificity phosphatase PhoE
LLDLPAGPPTLHPGLREYDVGAWSGLQLHEIESGWPGQIDRWRRGELAATPGGEERAAFEKRLQAAVCDLVDTQRGRRVLVVSHGGVIRSLFRSAGEEHRHIGQLAGCWLEVNGAQTSLTGTVDLIVGPRGEAGPEQLPSER